MNRVFQARGYFTVPDGTEVSPFLNATDATQEDVPWGALGEMSLAAGRVGPDVSSRVHVHPVVSQVTYLLAGRLTVRMKDLGATEPYDLRLLPGQAVLARPGTFFQLRNESESDAEVLYLVSPSYVFEADGGGVRYDDATLVAETWEQLAASGYEASGTCLAQWSWRRSERRCVGRRA